MLGQLETEICTFKLIIEESLDSNIRISTEEVSDFYFG